MFLSMFHRLTQEIQKKPMKHKPSSN